MHGRFAGLSVMLEEMRKDDQRVKYLWEVLERFSNEDRSRFLRFVTGRRRLPAIMHVVGELVSDFSCLLSYSIISALAQCIRCLIGIQWTEV